jgi:hypothetical protein
MTSPSLVFQERACCAGSIQEIGDVTTYMHSTGPQYASEALAVARRNAALRCTWY